MKYIDTPQDFLNEKISPEHLDILYKDKEIRIYVPKSREASIFLDGDAAWCTSHDSKYFVGKGNDLGDGVWNEWNQKAVLYRIRFKGDKFYNQKIRLTWQFDGDFSWADTESNELWVLGRHKPFNLKILYSRMPSKSGQQVQKHELILEDVAKIPKTAIKIIYDYQQKMLKKLDDGELTFIPK